MLLIIDNQSEAIKQFYKRLRKWGIEHIICSHSDKHCLEGVSGIILSGGPGTPYGPLDLTADRIALRNYDVPLMGICLGHEIIATAYGGSIARMEKQEKLEKVIIDEHDAIFRDHGDKFWISEKHGYFVSRLPDDFIRLAHSKACEIEVMRHKSKPIYGFQGHPEMHNFGIMKNFLRMCGFAV